MKYLFNTLILLLLFINLKSYAQTERKLPIEEINFEIGEKYEGKIIENYKSAVKIGLDKEVKNPKHFFENNVVYLFEVGGGCFYAGIDEISVTLKSNNIIFIDWQEPNEPCPEVGEMSATYGIVIISKKKFPNYKTMKLKYYYENE